MTEVFQIGLKWLVMAVLWALFRLGIRWDKKQRAGGGAAAEPQPKKGKVLPWRTQSNR